MRKITAFLSIAVLTLALGLVVACDTGTDEIEAVEGTLNAHIADEATAQADTHNRLAEVEAQVSALADATGRIEEMLKSTATAEAAAADHRNIWIPPADITEDMDPLEAATRCLTEKMLGGSAGGTLPENLGEEIMESFFGDLLPSEGEEAMAQMGPFLRYLFCGF